MLTRLTLLGTFLLVGCQSIDSDDIMTSGIYARVSATAEGDGSTLVRTTLFLNQPGNLDYLELEGDDLLSTYGPMGQEKIMRESQFLGMTSYSATFDTEDANSEFIVGLSRIVDTSAPDSRVSLPAPFDITTAEGVALSRANDNIEIAWNASIFDDYMEYSISGTCIDPVLSNPVETDPSSGTDLGTLTVLGTALVLRQDEEIDASCIVTVTLTRRREGIVDDNYGAGGDAFGYQSRDFSFTTEQ